MDVAESEDLKDLIENFRKKAINLLELLDLSIPTVAKLRVSISIFNFLKKLQFRKRNIQVLCFLK